MNNNKICIFTLGLNFTHDSPYSDQKWHLKKYKKVVAHIKYTLGPNRIKLEADYITLNKET